MLNALLFSLASSETFLDLTETTARIHGTGSITQAVVRSKSYDRYTEIIISEGPSSISAGAFTSCSKVQNMFISKSIKSIDFSNGVTFRYLSRLNRIDVDSENLQYSSDDQGVLYNKKKSILYRAPCVASIKIPSTVKTLSAQFFQDNSKLVSLLIPNTVTEIQNGIVYDVYSRPEIVFESNSTISEIASSVFAYTNARLISLPKSVKYLREGAFSNSMIEEIRFENESLLELIEPYCFGGALFTEINLPSNLLTISESSFENCGSLSTIRIPAATTEIHPDAFTGCTKLANIIIDSNNTAYQSLNGFVFSIDKKSLIIAPFNADKVYIPPETESIGKTAIQGCIKATEIEVNGSNEHFVAKDGVLYTPYFETAISVIGGRTEVVFDQNCSKINEYAMYNCKLATSIRFNGTKLSTIGDYSFYGCKGFIDIDLMSCESIGRYSFRYTKNIRNVTFSGNKLKSIGYMAFKESSIQYLYLPSSIESLSTDMTFGSNLKLCYIPIEASIKSFSTQTFMGSNYLETFIFSSHLQKINSKCFYGCTKLWKLDFTYALNLKIIETQGLSSTNITTIILPKNLETIQNSVFESCSMLTSVIFPPDNMLNSIGGGCFQGCVSLVSFEVPSNVTSLDPSVFSGCISLISITKSENNTAFEVEDGILYDKSWVLLVYPPGKIEAVLSRNLKEIGPNVFYKQSVIKKIHFHSDCPLSSITERTFVECSKLEELKLSKNIDYLDGNFIFGCESLKRVFFTSYSKLEELLASTFSGLSNLEEVSFEDGGKLAKVGPQCFKECTSLTTVHIPSGTSLIAEEAFSGCTQLSNFEFVESNSDAKLSINNLAFFKCSLLLTFDFNSTVYIGASSFRGSGLSEVNFSNEITHIGSDAFADCTALKYITYCGLNVITGSSFDVGVIARVRMSFLGQFSNCILEKSLDSGCIYHAPPTPESFVIPLIPLSSIAAICNNDESTNLNINTYWFFLFVLSYCDTANCKKEDKVKKIEMQKTSLIQLRKSLTVVFFLSILESRIIKNVTKMLIHFFCFFIKHSMESDMGVLYSDGGLTLIRGNAELRSFQIPSKVERLEDGDENYNCFGHCQITKSITIENNSKLSYIGMYSFFSTKITSLDLRACTYLKTIAYRAFLSSNIEDIFFPDSIEEISNEAFDRCQLTSLKIPPKVKVLYFWVFGHNKKLTTFTYDDNCLLSSIKSEAFLSSGLTHVTIPKSVSLLESAFFNNPLTSISIDGSDYYYVENGIVYSKNQSIIILGIQTVKSLVCGPNVTHIGTNSFRNAELANLTLNEGLISIGQGAFWGTKITEVVLPSTFVGGGNYEFTGCKMLTNVTFLSTNATTTISIHMFEGCTSLKEIILPRGVKAIGSYCFMDCSSLLYIWIPNTTITIGGGAFKGINSNCTIEFENGSTLIMEKDLLYSSQFKTLISCFDITGNSEVTVHWATEVISQTVFQDTQYQKVNFHSNSSLKYIQSASFKNSQITSITIPNTVISINNEAFEECRKLKTVNLSENLTDIPKCCFRNCILLGSIYIPKKVQTIFESAFEGCASVTTLNFAPKSELKTIDAKAFYNIGIGKLVLPNYLEKAGFNSFTIPSLERIEVPNDCNISTISPNMFANCIKLNSFDLGDSVKIIDESGFEGCTSLQSVSLPTSVETVNSYAFRNCESLSHFGINYGSKLSRIVGVAFTGCTKLLTISVANENQFKSVGCALYNYNQSKIILYLPSSTDTAFELPSTIVEIGGNAFQGCEHLERIVINEGCQTIGIFAFSKCLSLRSISIPESVTQILDSAFEGNAAFECGSVSFYPHQRDALLKTGIIESGLVPCPTPMFTGISAVLTLKQFTPVFIVLEGND